MDDSQSSDVFSETSIEIVHNTTMDTDTYKTLMSRLKCSLCKDNTCISTKYFSEVLQDCETCVYQCFDAIVSALEDTKLEFSRLCEHINDAVSLLQMLSNFIKSVLESIALACCSMKTYPTITGNIILTVFTHCKDSECIYGVYINKVENQLKDLFRSCHELQLTYLMSLEKHFTFDLSEKDELNVLMEALDINLKIGEVVEALDVKTMAEQWKAYTAICEKYSRHLLDKHIFNKCTKLFIGMIRNNVKSLIEMKPDDKTMVRCVKVAGFGIKILSKLCNIFKNATSKEYEDILDTIIYLYTFNDSYLKLIGKSQLSRLIESNIMVSLELLLGQIIVDNTFLNCVCNIEENKLQEEAYLGYILLLATLMNRSLNNLELGDFKIRIVKRVFWSLPFGHIWFNMGIKLKMGTESGYQQYGVFEHLLTVTAAFTKTFNSEEFSVLERVMFECLLNTDCYSAVFAANLWLLLLRSCDARLLSNTLMSLLKAYQKLAIIALFHDSPQKIYFTYILRKLFQHCSNQDKLLIYKQFNVRDKVNEDVWIALRISNLPLNVQLNAEQLVLDKLLKMINSLRIDDENIDDMIKLMNLSATCTHQENDIIDLLVRLWNKACPICNYDIKEIDEGSVWYFRYVEGLIALTGTVRERIPINVKIKILNTMSRILESGNTELIYLLFRSFCDLYDSRIVMDIQSNLFHLFEKRVLNSDYEIRKYIFSVVENRYAELYTIMQQNHFKNVLTEYNEYKRTQSNINEVRNRLKNMARNTFTHRCLKSRISERSNSKSNFDLADIDSLFDNDSDNEPVSKKAKLSAGDIEDLILRIEEDAALLGDVKENILSDEHKLRIANVCVKFKYIIEH